MPRNPGSPSAARLSGPIQGRLEQTRTLAIKRRAWRWMRRGLFMLSLGCLFTTAAGIWWYYNTGRMQMQLEAFQTTKDMVAKSISKTLSMNIDQIYLEGRDRMPKEEALTAIGVTQGDLTLSVDVEEVKKRLESSRWVDYAEVQRTLPSTLHVRIIERQPLALWQYKGTLHLIDHRGRPIEGENIGNYSYLPVIVGNTAPDRAYELMQALTVAPDLFARVSAAVLVNERRWNIRFYNGVEVMLPEQQPEKAWRKLAALQAEQQLIDRAITTVDMRQTGKLYVRLSENAEELMKQPLHKSAQDI